MSSTQKLLLQEEGGAPPERRTTSTLILNALLGAVPAAQYGWAIGVMNFPTKQMCDDLGSSAGNPLDQNGLVWSAAVNASFCVAGFAGSHFAGSLCDALGRRRLILLLNIPFLLAAGLGVAAGIVKGTPGFVLLSLARVVVGAASGAGSVVTPMFLGEIATPSTKGAFGALFQFGIVVFILIVQVAGVWMSSSGLLWGSMLGISGAFSVLSILTAPLLLESPKWLIARSRRDDAAKALATLRGCSVEDTEAELDELEEEAGSGGGQPMGLSAILADRSLRAPLLVTVVLLVTQQFSGINAVFFYSSGFFTDAGVNSTAGTLAAGAVNLLSTAIAIPLIERLGRRPLVLAGIGGMLASALALTGVLIGKAPLDPKSSATETLGYVAIVCVMLFVAFFEIGLGAIPWSIGGELFPGDSRGSAMALGAACNWVANTFVVLLFPLMNKALGNYSFLPFAAWLSVALAFAILRVPETKGKTPAQLIKELGGGYAAVGGGEVEDDAYDVKGLRASY